MHACMHVCMHAFMYGMYVCIHWMHTCMFICIVCTTYMVCMYAFMHAYILVRVYTCAYAAQLHCKYTGVSNTALLWCMRISLWSIWFVCCVCMYVCVYACKRICVYQTHLNCVYSGISNTASWERYQRVCFRVSPRFRRCKWLLLAAAQRPCFGVVSLIVRGAFDVDVG